MPDTGNSSVTDGPIVVFLLHPMQNPLLINGKVTITGSFNSTALVGPYAGQPFSTILTNMGSSNVSASPLSIMGPLVPYSFIDLPRHA